MSVMDEYIKILNEDINEFLKLILEKKYRKYITDEFFKNYIDARFYPREEKTSKTAIKKLFLKSIDEKKLELCKNNPERQQIIEQHAMFMDFVLYFDYLIEPESLELERMIKKVETIEDIKQKVDQIKKKHDDRVKKFISKFETKEFYLIDKECPRYRNTKLVSLGYEIDFPILYSEFAINQAFNTGKIYEDKYMVAYYLLSYRIINDILAGDLNKEYIVGFPETIFDKKQKLNKLLDIVDNIALKEKICFLVQYSALKKYKKQISDLIKKGFNVAIELNQKIDNQEAMRMEIYKYILVKKELKYYNELKKINKNLKIVEYRD